MRLGAQSVHMVYRRTRDEMPARHEEIEHAEEEGILFELLAAPLAFNGNAEMRLESVSLQRMRLGEPSSPTHVHSQGQKMPAAAPHDIASCAE